MNKDQRNIQNIWNSGSNALRDKNLHIEFYWGQMAPDSKPNIIGKVNFAIKDTIQSKYVHLLSDDPDNILSQGSDGRLYVKKSDKPLYPQAILASTNW